MIKIGQRVNFKEENGDYIPRWKCLGTILEIKDEEVLVKFYDQLKEWYDASDFEDLFELIGEPNEYDGTYCF